MTTPTAPTDPNVVHVCIGHHEAAHVRMKGARLVEAVREGSRYSGILPRGWTRLHIMAYRDDGRAWLLVFEPAPGAATEWQFRGFHVRGGCRLVERENNTRRARERFDGVPSD